MQPSREEMQRWEDQAQEASREASLKGDPGGHPEIDQKVLKLTRISVARIDADPKLVTVGLDAIERWTERKGGYVPPCHKEWKTLIESVPWEKLREMLLEESDEGQRLRSSHPFTDLVDEREREKIYAPRPA